MAWGIERMKQGFFNQSIGLVLGALPALVAHHILLIRQLGLIELLKQRTHAIAFYPQGQFQLIGRQRLEIVGAIKICGAVDLRRARTLENRKVLVFRDILGALKHHVFEQMRKARAPRLFVSRPDVIPEVDRHQRQPLVF